MVGQLPRECVKGDKAAGVERIDRSAAEVAYKQQAGGRVRQGWAGVRTQMRGAWAGGSGEPLGLATR